MSGHNVCVCVCMRSVNEIFVKSCGTLNLANESVIVGLVMAIDKAARAERKKTVELKYFRFCIHFFPSTLLQHSIEFFNRLHEKKAHENTFFYIRILSITNDDFIIGEVTFEVIQ